MFTLFLKNWKLIAIGTVGVTIALLLFYAWAYSKGNNACQLKYAKANQEAIESNSEAVRGALSRELEENAHRVRRHANRQNDIERYNGTDANDPAPALDQLFYDRLRRSVGEEH